MQHVENIIIAAAGRGKRLGLGLPKCLVRVQNRAIIEYQLHLVRHIPHVRLVVGYFEQDVVEFVRRLRPDVLFVRNPNFRHTSTLQSLTLAARGLAGNCLCMDGDMIIEEESFQHFLADCADGKPRIAVSAEITDDPVYAYVREPQTPLLVEDFGREKEGRYEWANIACIPAPWLAFEPTHFFEKLRQYCPLSASVIRRVEVDTPHDLAHAEAMLEAHPAYCRTVEQESP